MLYEVITEIHDGLGPVLSSAKMTLTAIKRDSLSDYDSEKLDQVESLVDNAIVGMREISNRLTPHVLELV